MAISQFGFLGGLLLGAASSIHCGAMCGGISSGILFMLDPRTPGSRVRTMLLANSGRAISYIAMGTLLGAVGASAVGLLPSPIAYRTLQWAGAVALMFIGLSTAELLPSVALADRVLVPIANGVGAAVRAAGVSPLAPMGMGLAWGFTPCAMVYGALFTAMFTGSGLGGALVMAGFALGTLPAVALTSLGLRSLALAGSSRWIKSAIGLAIAAFGFATVYLPFAMPTVFCW